jgi:hypothetical protein
MQYGITLCFNKGYKNILLLGPDVMLDYSNLSFMRNLFPVKSSGFKISLDIVRWIRTAITFGETAKKLVLGNRQGKQKCGSLSI